jgi:2,4-dienoyl-CoA reductase (NADPH2)
MNTQFRYLFEPIMVKGMALKNRLMMPAIHHLYTPEGSVTERFIQYYNARAEGGVGLLTVGGCSFDPYGRTTAMMSLSEDSLIPGWKTFTDEIHRRDGKVAVQLYHAGRYARQKNMPEGEASRGPSEVYASYTRETPRAMTVEEIKETVHSCALAAGRAKQAGFDAVELSASAGYLVCQFLAPLTNLRDDEYGGSWGNRCRFAWELVGAVREAVGPDYPILMRISGNAFVQGGTTLSDAVNFAVEMEKAGVDMFNVTGGWHESAIPQITGDVPPGGYMYLARAVRSAVSVPVAASNRLGDPVLAEETLAMRQADFISLGRPLVADPEWPNKVAGGRPGLIRGCVACNQGCLARTFFGKPVECLVNGRAGREYRFVPKAVKKPLNILVVGGGPAGCEFALRAAEQGHSVTLWEEKDRLGGQLEVVAAPPGKREFGKLIAYYEAALRERKVSVCLNTRADAEGILGVKESFDAVVVATGSQPRRIELPGSGEGLPQVADAREVLSGKVIPGKSVVILGGGSVGCETAEYVASRSAIRPETYYFLSTRGAESPEFLQQMLNISDRRVALVEITGKFGANFEPGTGWPVMAELKRFGVEKMGNSKLTGMDKGYVVIEQQIPEKEPVKHFRSCDTLILAVGSVSDDGLYQALEGKIPRLYRLGDASRPATVLDAVRQANDLAYDIDGE